MFIFVEIWLDGVFFFKYNFFWVDFCEFEIFFLVRIILVENGRWKFNEMKKESLEYVEVFLNLIYIGDYFFIYYLF